MPSSLPVASGIAIRTECHASDRTRMPGEGVYEIPRAGIPQPDSLIFPTSGTCDSVPIGAEGDALDLTRMPGEGVYEVA